ncbi:ribosome biogenesis/translation initiation ATPase RLI [Candidatus Woesearchaeota archaeon]|nr:ribosome biogenesis/translation initiation ATPase RLI [Candidatus Woesearchaeota archaeon]
MTKRIAVVDKEKCYPVKCGNHLCIRLCPVNRSGTDCIVEDPDDKKIQIIEETCTGCGICVHRCPFGAISIVNLPEELDKPPVHRYGMNKFALFSLPAPLFGKVVGLLGKNGIGKSTAFNVLAGTLTPNIGNYDEQLAPEEQFKQLINYFKGSEAQAFFEQLRDNKIQISYKPQQVDLIPKHIQGTVKQLLEKTGTEKEIERIAKRLSIEPILERKIDQISGGELQRVAIAAATLKEANVYFFDEPTSFLDIKQRIKTARFIRQLVNEETGVLVVEHDLILLDYMTDLIHLMYGKEDVFGIVSGVKPTRTGMNVYLAGYLREENVRFRDYKIEFLKRPPLTTTQQKTLTEWEPFTINLGDFSLEAEQGTISQQSIVGIVGENGIGKTTFVKALAGVLPGHQGIGVKISYKPQYLEPSEKSVAEVLQQAMMKYDAILVKPLNLHMLMDKQLNELSGGQLQRVYIAHALAQECDLYLLDEPSAYLDVEQRLAISKILRDILAATGRSALVVDHDLLFLDYISDHIMVFEGEPAKKGKVTGPFEMEEGMNRFLQGIGITFRRDEENNRPRANKEESQLDREQKKTGKFYYS